MADGVGKVGGGGLGGEGGIGVVLGGVRAGSGAGGGHFIGS